MKVDGACACGSVTYEAEVNPDMVAICHCTDCQTHSATAYGVVVGVVNGRFELLSGELKTYVKVAESGNERALTFCPDCGTRIYATGVGDGPSFMGLRVGTVRQRDQLKPRMQVWCRSARDWVEDLASMPKFDTQPSPDEMARLANNQT
jgi:hypothetical protein